MELLKVCKFWIHEAFSASEQGYCMRVYCFYAVVTVILATLTMYVATTDAAANLHKNLLQKILKWPAYMFDITPIGRIINRFSYDVDVLDNTLPFTLRQLFLLGGQVCVCLLFNQDTVAQDGSFLLMPYFTVLGLRHFF